MKKLLAIILAGAALQLCGKTFNILEFGAVGDGKTINTSAIQKAIDTCSKAKGKIVFPSGEYVTGTIFMKSDVHIELEEGAILYGSTNLEDYPFIDIQFPTHAKRYAHHALIFAEGIENFGFSGRGRVDGNGGHPSFNLLRESDENMHRPYMVQFINCKNVRMEGIEMWNPALWLHHYLRCENVFLRGLNVNSHAAANNDGMDIDDCKNVVVSDCIFFTEDDTLCFKSTTEYGTENVTVTNCVIKTNCNAIKFGTDSQSGFKRVSISNVVINEPGNTKETYFGTVHGICGIAIEAVDGGDIEHLNFSNISIHNVDTPFYIKIGDRHRKPTPESPDPDVAHCKDITFSNITAKGFSEFSSSIMGIPGKPVENVVFNNIILTSNGFTGYNPDEMLDVPEKSKNYPSPEIYGVFPTYGFYVRHAKNITFKNVQIRTEGNDSRHAFLFDDVDGFRVSEVDFLSRGNPSAIRIDNSTDGMITLNQLHEATDSLVEIHGETSNGIMLLGNKVVEQGNLVEVSAEVGEKAVFEASNWE